MTDPSVDASVDPAPLPATVGRFRIEREIARGSSGTVYVAVDPHDGRRVAIKLADGAVGRDGDRRARLEARAVTRLQHPNIVEVTEFGYEGCRPFLVMELVEGETLQECIERRGPLPVEDVSRIGAELAAALAHAHEHGVLHRDLKPDNVLLDESGAVRVVDFGLAKLTDAASVSLVGSTGSATLDGQLLGTPHYMSPEQVDGDAAHYGERSDVYGLGATLYTMMTGAPPFASCGKLIELLNTIAHRPPVDPRAMRSDLPIPLVDIVLCCLAKDPRDRPRTARAVAEALSGAGEPQQASRGIPSGPAAAWVVALVTALVAASAFVFLDRSTASPSETAAATPRRDRVGLDRLAWRTSVGLGDVKARGWSEGHVLVRGQKPDGFRWALVDPFDGTHQDLPGLRGRLTPARESRRSAFVGRGEEGSIVLASTAPAAIGEAVDPYTVACVAGQVIVGEGTGRVSALAMGRRDGGRLWEHLLTGRVETRPLPLDLDRDLTADHVLLGTCAGELALIRLGDGSIVGRLQAGGPLEDQSLRSFGTIDGVERVLASSRNGTLLVATASADGLTEASLIRHGSPFFGAAQVLTGPSGNPKRVVCATALGLTAFRPDLTVEWVSGPFESGVPRGEIALVDVDGDGPREIVVATRSDEPDGQSSLVVCDDRGRPRETLPLGERHVVLLGGPAERVIGHDRHEVLAWGPITTLPPAPAPTVADVVVNVLGGAHRRAIEIAEALPPNADVSFWRAVAEWFLGQHEPLERMSSGREAKLLERVIAAVRSHPLTYSETLRMSALPFVPQLSSVPQVETIPETRSVDAPMQGVDLKSFPYATSGVRLRAGNDRGDGVFAASAWIEMEFVLTEPQPLDLVFHHQSWMHARLAWSEVEISLDGAPVVAHWSATEAGCVDRLRLGTLAAGSHRLRFLATQRSLTVWRLYRAWLEPTVD